MRIRRVQKKFSNDFFEQKNWGYRISLQKKKEKTNFNNRVYTIVCFFFISSFQIEFPSEREKKEEKELVHL